MLSEWLSRFARKNPIRTLNPPTPLNSEPHILPDRRTPITADPPLAPESAAGVWSDRETTGASFSVDAVTPADRPMYTESLHYSLHRRFRRKILVLPLPRQPVVNAPFDSWSHGKLPSGAIEKYGATMQARLGSRSHPLMETVHEAFSSHYPLTLSPDCIWLAIAQGFGHHVTENAEALRCRLVRHQGRRQLLAHTEGLSASEFEQAIAGISAQIRDASDPVVAETLICDFTTTTPAIRTASEVVLMDTFSSYFQYRMMCVCGIPKITLTGTVDDWQRIRARVEVLETFDLGWWVSRLRPILDEFVEAASGNPRADFWKAIYKPEQAYATTLATGWITDLFPYLGDASPRRRNPTLEQDREGMALSALNGIDLGAFPSGIVSVPLEIQIESSTEDTDLVAGYFGVRQNPADLALTPAIGWCVTEPRPKKPVII